MATPRWQDPFDDMSDEEFDAHVDTLFANRPRAVGVSLRVNPDLLERIKRQAARADVPYQTFMKSVLETAVTRLELHTPATTRGTGLTAKLKAEPTDRSGRRRASAESLPSRSKRARHGRTSTETRRPGD